MSKLFPCIMILLSLCSAIGYAFESDWRRSVYWVAASVLTAAVTF